MKNILIVALCFIVFALVWFGLTGAAMIYIHPVAGFFVFLGIFALVCKYGPDYDD